jgi:hypothetical protein
MSIPASVIYYYCKSWRARDRSACLNLYLRSCFNLSRPFPLFLFLLLGAVVHSSCMTLTVIHIFYRHVWTGLTLFDFAFLNYIIIVYSLIRSCADKALKQLFSTDLKISIFYTAVLKTHYSKTQLPVVFSLVLRFFKSNFINVKCLCFL